MAKRLRQFVGCILVIANILSSNAVILAEDFVDTEPTETVAVETEEAKEEKAKEEKKEESTKEESKKEPEESTKAPVESSESSESSESETSEPTPASAQDREDESMPSESSESSESAVSEETSETTEDTVPTPAEPLEGNTVKGTITRMIIDAEGKTYKVTASYDPDTGIPDDAELVVEEIISGDDYDEYYNKAVEALEGQDVGYVRFFDISIVKDGVEYEPAEGTTVNVKIQLEDTLGSDVSVVHFADDKKAEVIETTSVKSEDGTEIVFEADGFSAYAIVETDMEPIEVGWASIKDPSLLASMEGTGFYVSGLGGYYLTGDHVVGVSGNADRYGLTATSTTHTTVPTDEAVMFYFEPVPGTTDQFYIYKMDGENRVYVQLTRVTKGSKTSSRGSVKFAEQESDRTAFKLVKDGNNGIKVSGATEMTDFYWNRNTNNPYTGAIAAYNDGGNSNTFKLTLHYRVSVNPDPYDLEGKLYGLMSWTSGTIGKGLMASSEKSGAGHLDALALAVLAKKTNNNDRIYVSNEADITMWTFEYDTEDKYFVTATVNGTKQYIQLDDTGVSMTTTPTSLRVIPGTGEFAGQISLVSDDYAVTYSGSVDDGFGNSGADSRKWLHLVDETQFSNEYYRTYSANKVSVSDTRNVHNDSRVLIYTRVWDDDNKQYKFYAVDHEGNLVHCYEDGDMINWVGTGINSLLWDFTEYYWEGTTDPNYYYELYNEYSEKYISPLITNDQVLSDTKPGINLLGRKNNQYYTKITAWDDDSYAYVGLKTENGKVVPCPIDEAEDFYFAIMEDVFVEDRLTPVPTVDNDVYGITMKMVDFTDVYTNQGEERAREQDDVVGFMKWDPNKETAGLLSTKLVDGYPTVKSNGQSLETLFTNAVKVNNLFLDSVYRGSGYFEYNSEENFASLRRNASGDIIVTPDGMNFDVFQELGTADTSGKSTLKHGIFLPYNYIEAGRYAKVNPLNEYSALGPRYDNDYPRKGEKLYLVNGKNDQGVNGKPNYYFGIELETTFVQTTNGKDDWGHDIIYEFTGDDDFWLYVDDQLVLDLGGIHSAYPGSVNFSTGVVIVNGKNYILKDIFYDNFVDQGMDPDAAQAKVDSLFDSYVDDKGVTRYVFKDYTEHTMKVFYMERGGGSSNLHMRFNQSSIKPGTIVVGKKISGVDDIETSKAEFPFQIWYTIEEQQGTTNKRINKDDPEVKVCRRGTDTVVDSIPSIEIDGNIYEDIYYLKPGEELEIKMPNDAIAYWVVECGVSPFIFNEVKVNGSVVQGTATAHGSLMDYAIPPQEIRDRTSVEFDNHVNPEALRNLTFRKVLLKEDGVTEIHDDPANPTFDFRLYVAGEGDQLQPSDMYIYHVKDENGYYCSWNPSQQKFQPIRTDTTDYSQLTADEKKASSFHTSMNGAISKIPPFYTVEVRELLVGSKYKIQERDDEMPDGYSRQKFVWYRNIEDPNTEKIEYTTSYETGEQTIAVGETPHIDVRNIKGYGIRAYKSWTDDPYMADRDDAYFAIYTGPSPLTDENDLVLDPDSVMALEYGSESVYWYYPRLADGYTLDNYYVREVQLSNSNPTVNPATGKVTNYGTVTPVAPGDDIKINGRLKCDTVPNYPVKYTVSYEPGQIQANTNIRVDQVTNDRPGILIKKKCFEGEYLEGAKFVIDDGCGHTIGPFVSDATGEVTKLFISDTATYTITEQESPLKHRGISDPISISLDANKNIVITGIDPQYYDLTQFSLTSAPVLEIKNKPYRLKVLKVDEDGNPVEGATFALHRERTVGGAAFIDYTPMPGFETLVTGADGVVPDIDQNLPHGTYEIREVSAAPSYQAIAYGVRFTINDFGEISLKGTYTSDVNLNVQEVGNFTENTISIVNHLDGSGLTITKQVEGNLGNRFKAFPFLIKLFKPDKSVLTGEFSVSVNGAPATAVQIGADGYEFSLAHNDKITFYLPDNTKYTVQETDPSGYKVTSRKGKGVYVESDTVTGALPTDNKVNFINTREGVIPTGLETSFNLSVSTLCALTAGVAVSRYFFFRRRREEEES